MEGSKLYVTSPETCVARAWIRLLNFRMRERKLFDRYPGTQVEHLPFAQPANVLAPSHAERLAARLASARGSVFEVIYDLPRVGHEDSDCDFMLDTWILHQQRAFLLNLTVGGWGSCYPKVVLVGDRYNGEREARLPFSNKLGASKTLSDLLNHADLKEPDLYLVNAYTASRGGFTRTICAEDFAVLGQPRVVALGSNAAQAIEEAGVKSYARFPHPQYLAQFENGKLRKWGLKLRALVEDVLLD